MAFNVNTSIQEAAANFATTVLASLNAAAAEIAGTNVMWFRAVPDKKSQDVLFQNYTLFGVEDCPLEFSAMYTETNYDDAGMVYGMFGTEYITPFYIEIARNVWEDVTGNDGTIPQKGDIAFIPNSRKLLQVKSMTPVKQMGAQLTSYKVSLEEYKPTRSRIVPDNLQTSIEESTTNLDERFGTDIEKNIKNIVDDAQLSIFNSTSQDKHKKVTAEKSESDGVKRVRSIVKENITVDGHVVARSYYNMNTESGDVVVRYNATDSATKDDGRCFSCWCRINSSTVTEEIKNIKTMEFVFNSKNSYIKTTTGTKFNIGDDVMIERGEIKVIGTITDTDIVTITVADARRLISINENWYRLPGFVMHKIESVKLLSSNGSNPLGITLKGNSFVEISIGDSKYNVQLDDVKYDVWNAFVINLGTALQVDTYCGSLPFSHTTSRTLDCKKWNGIDVDEFFIESSNASITNIRLYDIKNTDVDRQIKDVLYYNSLSASNAIINDSADVYLNAAYTGKQR